jgi:drug/metabolite transporter (DMT)-like permease
VRAGRSDLLGISLVLGASACFSALDTTTKVVSASVPLLMALWFRYAFQALATTAVVLPWKGTAVLRTRHLPFQLLRGVLLLTSSLLAFLSLRYMPVGEFTAIVMMSPLAVTLLAATVLKEHVSGLRWTLVAGGFAGTLVIIRPGGESFSWAMLLPLGLVVSNAWFQVLTSKLARTEDPVTMHLYTGWVGTLLASLALPFVWAPVREPLLWLALCFMGLMGTVGHFMLILAYRNAPGRHAHALPVLADRLRHAARLVRVRPRPRRLVAAGHGDHRHLRRRRRLAHRAGARAPAPRPARA